MACLGGTLEAPRPWYDPEGSRREGRICTRSQRNTNPRYCADCPLFRGRPERSPREGGHRPRRDPPGTQRITAADGRAYTPEEWLRATHEPERFLAFAARWWEEDAKEPWRALNAEYVRSWRARHAGDEDARLRQRAAERRYKQRQAAAQRQARLRRWIAAHPDDGPGALTGLDRRAWELQALASKTFCSTERSGPAGSDAETLASKTFCSTERQGPLSVETATLASKTPCLGRELTRKEIMAVSSTYSSNSCEDRGGTVTVRQDYARARASRHGVLLAKVGSDSDMDLDAVQAYIEANKPELVALQQRCEKGLVWLAEHDPQERFHLWYVAKLTPFSPMPAQGQEVIKAWTDYFNARVLWERLDRQCSRLEEAARRELEAAATA